jgi:hypothetical protein
MTDLEKFLRQASRGLWGRERQTVRRELESHIRHRANRYEVSGSSETEAIKLAIADLGEARAINSGMKGVYSVPTTIRAGVLTAALATFVFMGAQLSTAQVTGTTKFLTPACIEQGKTSFTIAGGEIQCENNWFSINFESLKTVLEPLGVQVQVGEVSAVIKWPEGAVSVMNTDTSFSNFYIEINGKSVMLPPVKGYVQSFTFFDALRDSGLPVHINGWDNPHITIGKTKFTLGSSSQVARGASIFPNLLQNRLDLTFWFWPKEQGFWTETPQSALFEQAPLKQFKHIIKTNLEPGSIVVVVSREAAIKFNEKANSPRHKQAFIAPVGPDGSIEYPSFSRTLAVVNPRDVQVGVHNGHATISVLRFSGEYSNKPTMLEPVAPATIKIESR